MTELRNVEADLSRFRVRVFVASIVVLLAFFLLASRLFWLQVVRHDELLEQAENNRTTIVPVVPNRGLILDRNGIVRLHDTDRNGDSRTAAFSAAAGTFPSSSAAETVSAPDFSSSAPPFSFR